MRSVAEGSVRRVMALGAAALIAAAVGACGSDEPPDTPAACAAPARAYLEALEGAPGEVLIAGTTPIGDCLVEEQDPGVLATVGEAMVAAATELNRAARTAPDRQLAVQLGYLVGAARQASSSTGGIHEDLVLRLESAARYAGKEGDSFGAAFERSFGQGYAAGQAGG